MSAEKIQRGPRHAPRGGERTNGDARSRHTDRICLPSTADEDEGETKQEALIRECKEELDVTISVEKGPPTRCNLGGERRSRDARSRHTNRICLPSTADDDAFMDVIHEYPDITVHLTLFHAQIVSGEIKLLEHNAVAWITPDEIPHYAFCPADKEINECIAAEYGNTSFYTGDNE